MGSGGQREDDAVLADGLTIRDDRAVISDLLAGDAHSEAFTRVDGAVDCLCADEGDDRRRLVGERVVDQRGEEERGQDGEADEKHETALDASDYAPSHVRTFIVTVS